SSVIDVKTQFKWITQELGPARELDVFIKRVVTPAALVLDRKKLAAFLAAAGRFLRFPIGDRRGTRMRASASKRPVTRAQALQTPANSSGVAPASPQAAYRALLESGVSNSMTDLVGNEFGTNMNNENLETRETAAKSAIGS